MLTQDAKLFAVFLELLERRFQEAGYTVDVLQGYQPTKQNMRSGPSVFMSKLFDQPIGQPERKETLTDDPKTMLETTSQWVETTVQFSGYSPREGKTLSVTSSDVANYARLILSGDELLALLREIDEHAQVLRVGIVRSTYPKNEADQYVEWASFDLVLSRRNSMIRTIPATADITGKFFPIQ